MIAVVERDRDRSLGQITTVEKPSDNLRDRDWIALATDDLHLLEELLRSHRPLVGWLLGHAVIAEDARSVLARRQLTDDRYCLP